MTDLAAPLVLASSPLLGPTALVDVATALRATGRAVVLPDVPADPDDFVDVVATATSPTSVVVGFSAAGPRLFAVADRTRPAGLVFLDARLPADGVAPDREPAFADLLDALPQDADGRLPPWPAWWPDELLTELVPDPGRRSELLRSSPRVSRSIFARPIPAPAFEGPCGFVGLGDGYADAATEARRRGWPTVVVDGAHHLWPVVEPDAVARAIADVVQHLGGGPR